MRIQYTEYCCVYFPKTRHLPASAKCVSRPFGEMREDLLCGLPLGYRIPARQSNWRKTSEAGSGPDEQNTLIGSRVGTT